MPLHPKQKLDVGVTLTGAQAQWILEWIDRRGISYRKGNQTIPRPYIEYSTWDEIRRAVRKASEDALRAAVKPKPKRAVA